MPRCEGGRDRLNAKWQAGAAVREEQCPAVKGVETKNRPSLGRSLSGEEQCPAVKGVETMSVML